MILYWNLIIWFNIYLQVTKIWIFLYFIFFNQFRKQDISKIILLFIYLLNHKIFPFLIYFRCLIPYIGNVSMLYFPLTFVFKLWLICTVYYFISIRVKIFTARIFLYFRRDNYYFWKNKLRRIMIKKLAFSCITSFL